MRTGSAGRLARPADKPLRLRRTGHGGVQTYVSIQTLQRPVRAATRGFTLVFMLLLVAVLSLGLSYAGPRWALEMQREQEQELLRVGQDYVRALESYRADSPGSSKDLPLRLEDLLEDTRFVGVRRHIRRLHGDPVANGAPFVVLRSAGGRIVGVRSSSTRAALAQPRFALRSDSATRSSTYADWEFRVEKAQ